MLKYIKKDNDAKYTSKNYVICLNSKFLENADGAKMNKQKQKK